MTQLYWDAAFQYIAFGVSITLAPDRQYFFALFKDNGVRHIGKVLIALRPGRNDKKFIDVADRISQFYSASFSLLRVVPEEISDEELDKLEDTSLALLNSVKSEFHSQALATFGTIV